jgi:hypothetical protein
MTDLHFCNFCDQSVPIVQLDNGEAIRHGGRVVCPTCCDTLAMATRGEAGRKRGGGGLALLVGLIGWAGLAFLYLQQDGARSDNATNLNTAVLQLSDSIAIQSDTSTESTARQEEKLGEFKAIVQQGFSTALNDIAGLDESLTAVRIQVEQLEGLADGQTSLEQETRALRTQMQITEDSVRDVRKGLEFLRDNFADLERKMVVATAAPPESTGFSSEVQNLLKGMKADDPLTRVAAIEELGKHQDPALIPYVEPMLQDPYEMNRFYAAYTLGEWQAMASVPALIEALEDDFAFVADAVNEALINISKEDMGFDSKGSVADRKKAVQKWQAWWKKNSE